MRTMSIRELRGSLASIAEIVERDGDIVVTRNGRPVAKVVPLERRCSVPSHADLRASMPVMVQASEDLIRSDRERG